MAEQGLSAKLVQLTEHYLAMHLHDSAVFTAERLLAVAPSEANRHLLATALVHGGHVARACAVLRGSRSPANVYLLARYCIETGAYAEAESVLLEAAGLAGRDADAVVLALQGRPYALPNGAAGAYLLAWAVHRAGRVDVSAKYYLLCLYLDPFNFAAYEALCKMGYYPHPAQTFTGARLTATGAFSDKPPKQEPARRGAAPLAPTGLIMPSGDTADVSVAAHATAPLAVPSPLLSPITPAAKLLLLSPQAAAPPVPPHSSVTGGISTPVLNQRSDAGAATTAAAHTRPAPPHSALRSHPALAASLVGVASADRFGFAVAGPGDHGPHGDAAFGGAAAAAAFLGDLSAISPVPPEYRNDGTALWSRVLGTSMAPPESGGRFGGGGGMRTEDFLRRPAGIATAHAPSAFGTPATGGAVGGRGRFMRHGGATTAAGAGSAVSGGSNTSAVRPFVLPPGSAATVASAPGAGAAAAGAHHGAHTAGAADRATGVASEWEAMDMGAAEEGTPAAVTAGFAAHPGASPALVIPGPAGIIMAGKRKARYVGGSELSAPSAGGPGGAGAVSTAAGPRGGAASGSRGGGAAPPSTVARPRFKRLSFSAGDGVAAAASAAAGAAAAAAAAGSAGQGLASPQHGARAHGGSGSASAARALASQPPPPSPSMRRLRSHSDALAAASDASPAAVSPNPKARGLPRAASARHIAGPAFIAAALKGDDATSGAAATGPARVQHQRGTPAAAAAASLAAAAAAPRAPSVPDVLQRGAQQLLLLLRTMAFAVRHLARFECEAALSTLAQLPEAQAESPWGLAVRARAKHELGQHAEARLVFKLLHEKAPQRLDGMDVYSTVLWHLKAVPELTALADELIAAQPGKSTSWVVAANRFSVGRDHKRAIGALQRALQLDPGNVNAHTLLGHERTALALLDEALASFQRATGLEHRHYAAWYGMGTVYFRQGALDLAELHYRKACDIHRHSPTLMCYLGMVLTAGKRFDAALEQLGRASALDPANPQVEYQKALVYGATGKHDLARRSLLRVLSVAPGEPAVLMQLGKACKHLGLFEEAATHLNAALGRCGPADKQSNIIRGMLQSLAAPTEDGDVVL